MSRRKRSLQEIEFYQELGQRLREFRSVYNLSRRELAEMIGYTETAIKHWEDGEGGMTILPLVLLHQASGVPYEWLLPTPAKQ